MKVSTILSGYLLVSVLLLGWLFDEIHFAAAFVIMYTLLFALQKFLISHEQPLDSGLFYFLSVWLPAFVLFILRQDLFTIILFIIPFFSFFVAAVSHVFKNRSIRLSSLFFDFTVTHYVSLSLTLLLFAIVVLYVLPAQYTMLTFIAIVLTPCFFVYKFILRLLYNLSLEIKNTVQSVLRALLLALIYTALFTLTLSVSYVLAVTLTTQAIEAPLVSLQDAHEMQDRTFETVEQIEQVTGTLQVIDEIKQEIAAQEITFEERGFKEQMIHVLNDEWIYDLQDVYYGFVRPSFNLAAMQDAIQGLGEQRVDHKEVEELYKKRMLSDERIEFAGRELIILANRMDSLTRAESPLGEVVGITLNRSILIQEFSDLRDDSKEDLRIAPLMRHIYERRNVDESSASKELRYAILYAYLTDGSIQQTDKSST